MDEIVQAALKKWPNVPHCFGWLALDARGTWRMRDERCQALNLRGDAIRNQTLIGFINRNYLVDEQGRWYFQNGPQRVYVDLEAAPYIVHTTHEQGLVFHTGEAVSVVNTFFITQAGQLLLQAGDRFAQVDDRDLATCFMGLQRDGRAATDDDIAELLNAETATQNELQNFSIVIHCGQNGVSSARLKRGELPDLMQAYGYNAYPRQEKADKS